VTWINRPKRSHNALYSSTPHVGPYTQFLTAVFSRTRVGRRAPAACSRMNASSRVITAADRRAGGRDASVRPARWLANQLGLPVRVRSRSLWVNNGYISTVELTERWHLIIFYNYGFSSSVHEGEPVARYGWSLSIVTFLLFVRSPWLVSSMVSSRPQRPTSGKWCTIWGHVCGQ